MNRRRSAIGVLIVEDSTTVRTLLEHMVDRDPRLELLGSVASGEAALRAIATLEPDVVSMDVRLPGMSGLDATREIMRSRPTPIVVVAADVDDAESMISINALRAGALSVVEKPAGLGTGDLSGISKRICDQLAIMSEVKLVRQRRVPAPTPPRNPLTRGRLVSGPRNGGGDGFELLGVAASTGGPNALPKLFTELGGDFPLPIALVQHITDSFAQSFVTWLDGVVPQTVVFVDEDGCDPVAGRVYAALPGKHLCARGGRLVLEDGPMVCNQLPSASVLFETMARSVGCRSLAIVLTGMGSDGAQGMRAIFDAGGYTIAESRETALVSGMPDSARATGGVTESLPLYEIAARVRDLTMAQRITA